MMAHAHCHASLHSSWASHSSWLWGVSAAARLQPAARVTPPPHTHTHTHTRCRQAMRVMNKRMNLPNMQKVLMEFERQNERMEMTSDMMGDAIDDAMEVTWGPTCRVKGRMRGGTPRAMGCKVPPWKRPQRRRPCSGRRTSKNMSIYHVTLLSLLPG